MNYANRPPLDENLQQLNDRMDAYTALLSAGHRLYQSVLALQFVDTQGDLAALREHLITELYQASDLYIEAYMKVYPKGGAR